MPSCGNGRAEERAANTDGLQDLRFDARNAWAEWDGHDQNWRLGAVYDYAFCHKCEGDTRIVELPI